MKIVNFNCGCMNQFDEKSGLMFCALKCPFHVQWSQDHPQGDTADYFKDIGYLDHRGIPQNKRLIDELKEALSAMHAPIPLGQTVLELGCGLGAYVPFFLKYGNKYVAVERSHFSAEWTRNNYDVTVYEKDFEEFETPSICYTVIFGAHIFEHLKDAPAALKKVYRLLNGAGGMLYVIVPDDGDPTNPDHLWFFTEETLRRLLEKIGFKNICLATFKRVPQENFIYCVAYR